MSQLRSAGRWMITDSGVLSAVRNMEVDQRALESMMRGLQKRPSFRFFGWDKPAITYGYLLDKAKVRAWAQENGNHPIVQRPTGGGAVVHSPNDLSLSILWPRKSGFLPDKPSECYARIHSIVRSGLRRYLAGGSPTLFRGGNSCETAPSANDRFSVCFTAPVCDDVMLGERKVVGGALRVTRQAVLYQGAVQLGRTVHMERLKASILSAFMELLFEESTEPARAAAALAPALTGH